MGKSRHARNRGNGDMGGERSLSENENFGSCREPRELPFEGRPGSGFDMTIERIDPFFRNSAGNRVDEVFRSGFIVLEIRKEAEEEFPVHQIPWPNRVIRDEFRAVGGRMERQDATNAPYERVHGESLKKQRRGCGEAHRGNGMSQGGGQEKENDGRPLPLEKAFFP